MGDLKKIFDTHAAKKQAKVFQTIDVTLSVKKVMELFKVT